MSDELFTFVETPGKEITFVRLMLIKYLKTVITIIDTSDCIEDIQLVNYIRPVINAYLKYDVPQTVLPIAAKTPIMFFKEEHEDSNTNLTTRERHTILMNRWREIDQTAYIELGKLETERYAHEYELFNGKKLEVLEDTMKI